MFEGPPPETEDEDVWEEIANEMTKTQKVLKGLHPIAPMEHGEQRDRRARGADGVVPDAAGGAGGGDVGARRRQRPSPPLRQAANRLRSETAPASVAEAVAYAALNFKSLDPDDVERVAAAVRLDPDEFQRVLSTITAATCARSSRRTTPSTRTACRGDAARAAPPRPRPRLERRHGDGAQWRGDDAHRRHAAAKGADAARGAAAALAHRHPLRRVQGAGVGGRPAGDARPRRRRGRRGRRATSSPLYRKAVSRAVAKFNLTEAPDVLQKARPRCSSARTARRGSTRRCTTRSWACSSRATAPAADGRLALLGELEAMLQLRGSSGLMQARTVPMARRRRRGAARAPRRQDGRLACGGVDGGAPAAALAAVGPLEARRRRGGAPHRARAARRRRDGAGGGAHRRGAAATLQKLLSYASAYGTMLHAAAWEADSANPDDLAAQYLGALTLDEALEGRRARSAKRRRATPSTRCSRATSPSTTVRQSVRPATRARCQPQWRVTPHPDRRSPSLPPRRPKRSTLPRLDELISSGGTLAPPCARGRTSRAARAADLGLPAALRQRLSLDTYYTWLLDLTEKMDVAQLEKVSDLRGCLQLYDSSLGELYTETEIDELVLAKVAESFVAGNLRKRLTADQRGRLTYLEAELQARPGSAARVGS